MRFFPLFVVGLLVLCSPAIAQNADPRIQLAAYDPGQVYNLPVLQGFAAIVEFAPGENVESVVVGNSALWQVTTSAKGDRIVVKPLMGASPTNMVVVTQAHSYTFFLNSSGSAQDIYVLRFTYDGAGDGSSGAVPLAGNYRLTGSKRIRPLQITDDGRTTAIVWSDQTAIPAMFSRDEAGEESIVNGRMVAGRYVIEGVFPKLIFRLGRDQVVAERRNLKVRQ